MQAQHDEEDIDEIDVIPKIQITGPGDVGDMTLVREENVNSFGDNNLLIPGNFF